jgi:hypothetical protein
MSEHDLEAEMIEHACKGDAAAMDFVHAAWALFHAVDDLIDEQTESEFRVKLLVSAMSLYAHPFFVRHAHALNAIIRNCASTYMDSVAWEKSEDADKRAWADVARHCGLELLFAVADICGGWEHRRAVSREWREYNLRCHQQAKAAKSDVEKGT